MGVRDRGIVKAMADNRLNITQAGKQIYLSKQTVFYHVEAIYDRTGLDPRDFWDMCELVRQYDITQDGEVTALGYMERQLTRCRMNYERAKEREAKKEELVNLARKIGYYESAVNALRSSD